MRTQVLLAAAAALAAANPVAASEKKVEEYLQAFWTAALWQDPGKTGANAAPISLTKFSESATLKIAVGGTMGDSYRDHVATRIGPFLKSAGINYEILAANGTGANIELKFITFLPNTSFDAACVTRRRPYSGVVERATLEVLDRQVNHCLAHEMMHVIGFAGHPHDSDSILSYVRRNHDFTEVDRVIARVLYDPRLKPGTYHVHAMALARDVLVDHLIAAGAPAATKEMGRNFVANVPKVLEQIAVAGRLPKVGLGQANFQLAIAYTFGHVVDKDEAKGFQRFTKAAELYPNWSEVQFYMGYALHAGRGTAPDLAQGIDWYKKAAAQRHTVAQNNLGNAYWSGKGVDKDIVEAYKWFQLAAERGYEVATRNRARLGQQLSPEQQAEALRRAKDWKPESAQ